MGFDLLKAYVVKYIGWILMAGSVLGNILVNMRMVEGQIVWILMAGSVLGNILVNMRMVEGQIVWLVAGIGWVLYAKYKKEYALMTLYLVCSALSVWGIIAWM